jgi:hypothetical protein
MSGAYLSTQRIFGIVLVVVGVAMIVSAVARGGGPLAVGVVAGTLFGALGVARLVLARVTNSHHDQ